MNASARLRTLVPAAWAGLLLAVALLAAPAAFAMLARVDAGKVVGHLFAREAAVSLIAAVVFVVLERRAGGRPLGANVLLALGALFCTVAGYYALQPMMEAARAGRGGLSFAQLHGVSTAFFGLKTVLVLAIAWRVSAPVRPS